MKISIKIQGHVERKRSATPWQDEPRTLPRDEGVWLELDSTAAETVMRCVETFVVDAVHDRGGTDGQATFPSTALARSDVWLLQQELEGERKTSKNLRDRIEDAENRCRKLTEDLRGLGVEKEDALAAAAASHRNDIELMLTLFEQVKGTLTPSVKKDRFWRQVFGRVSSIRRRWTATADPK